MAWTPARPVAELACCAGVRGLVISHEQGLQYDARPKVHVLPVLGSCGLGRLWCEYNVQLLCNGFLGRVLLRSPTTSDVKSSVHMP